MLLRSEKRRRKRELIVSRSETDSSAIEMVYLPDEEFVATLSQAERAFYFDVLMVGKSNDDCGGYSKQNTWQLRHRVRKKFERYISESS